MIIECESIIQKLGNDNDKKRIRWEVGNVADKIFKKSLYNSKNEQKLKATVTKLKNKIKKNDIIVTKADKGNTMVLLRKDEYIKKTEEFIRDGPYEEIKYDYTSKYLSLIHI